MLPTRSLNARPTTPVTANTTLPVRAAAKEAAKSPVKSPALTDGALMISKPPTSAFQALHGTKADLLSGAVSTGGTNPPTPPNTGGGTVASIVIFGFDLDVAFQALNDLSESKGPIIDGILDFIDNLPKPE